MSEMSRRDFIRAASAAAGAGALGSLPGCCVPGLSSDPRFWQFDYVVVLMMENRSFDNLLGYLYDPASLPPGVTFNGVIGKNLSNPIPPDADPDGHLVVPFEPGFVYDNPNPDPGEPYPHVNTQLFNTVIPASNRYKSVADMLPPYNLPDPVPGMPSMSGFVRDYIDNFITTEGRMPTYDEFRVIMLGYQPDTLPVTNTLARRFGVCDNWHCAVPSQTFCNRSFFNSGQSSGFVVNSPYYRWPLQNSADTIFNRIDGARKCELDWGIYFDLEDVFSLTALIHFQRLKPFPNRRIRSMQRFYEDVATGKLPRYTFIEPRLFLNHNDMHPPVMFFGHTQPSSLLPGEILINDIYNAIRNSDSAEGNNYQNTLFVITFDEHGGCYDHAPPGAAVPPDSDAPPGQMGFRFDRLGVRVPTIFISSFIESETIINTPLHHCSVIKTICEKWGLPGLTDRDKNATDLAGIFNRSSPRSRDDWPVITPLPIPPEVDASARALDRPLNDLQRAILGMAAAVAGGPTSEAPAVTTIGEATAYLHQQADAIGWRIVE